MTAPASGNSGNSGKANPDFPAIGERDQWGNVILSARGWYGEYRIKGWATGKEAFVCGQRMNQTHLPYWEFTWEQGYICRRCWPQREKAKR